MNITFFAILFFSLGIAVFIKNLINLDTRGYRKYVWIVFIICFFIISIQFLHIKEYISELPHFLYLDLLLKFLIGPFLYFLMKARLRKNIIYRLKDYLHYLPAAICFFLLFPFLISDNQEKLNYLWQIPETVTILIWILPIQMSLYLILILSELKFFPKFKINKADNRWIPFFGFAFYWLYTLIDPIANGKVMLFGILSGIQLGTIMLIYKRISSGKKKQLASNSDADVIKVVEKAMMLEKLYLDKDLNLALLANLLNLSTNKISKALNNELSTNYNDYINKYRVNEVINLFEDQDNNKYTLEAISEMAGFRSLTTFNTSFKKQTGKTPREFKVLTEL